MQEVIDDIIENRNTCKNLKIKAGKNDARKVVLEEAFNRCHNYLTICLELLSHYFDQWNRPFPRSLQNEALINQNGERVMHSTKSTFIFSMSAIEFSIINALRINSYPLEELSKRVYLSMIMKNSSNQIINKKDSQLWNLTIRIRNKIVHNNGIWDKDSKTNIEYPNGLIVNLFENNMIQGDLRFFTLLMKWMITAYLDWCEKLMVK